MPATSCPALQHLSIAHCSSISDTALLHFITAKMGQFPTTLTHVDVQFDRHMTLDILPNLKAFTALDISITHLLPPPSQFSPWQGLIHAPW
ncbi:hypothetical protein B0H19DRAFT_1096263 [Mycena capillaripes]|nr:hypothetical protein B0H19DRAFT_1096263 [Mycena capillaripes]